MTNGTAIFGGPGDIYRYVLARAIESNAPSRRRLLVVMINPSTATDVKNDHTITKLEGFAERWGHGELAVVNLFAFRTRDVKELVGNEVDIIGPENDLYIRRQAAGADDIMIAWGALHKIPLSQRSRPSNVTNFLKQSKKPIFCLGRTKCGQPKHPLTLAYATPREMIG